MELVPFIVLLIFSFSNSSSPPEPFNYEAVLVRSWIFMEAGKSAVYLLEGILYN